MMQFLHPFSSRKRGIFLTTVEHISTRRYQDYESYECFEFDRFTLDEKTKVSEQINGVMENSFEYRYGADGELYFQGESLPRVFERGITQAERVVHEHPAFTIELLRRHIEYKQYQSQRRVGQQDGDNDPYILLHISMMPEAVNHGVDLGAYDRKRQKIMIRATEPIAGGVRTTSASLDGGNRTGVQSMADVCEGVDIPDEATPEDIMAEDFWIRQSHLKGDSPIAFFRKRYDAALALQYGGDWYAGRQDSPIIGTLQLIEQCPKHAQRYVRAVYALKQQYGDSYEMRDEYRTLNYDFVKLMERLGREPDYEGSAVMAGGDARANGEMVAESDCPTGNNLTAQASISTEQMLAIQGIGLNSKGEYIDTCMKCPHCKTLNVKITVDNNNLYYTCYGSGGCGRSTLPTRSSPSHQSKVTVDTVDHKRYRMAESERKDDMIKQQFGEHAIIKREIAIGGMIRTVIDKRTNEVYARL